jgi:hypothetical protein
VASWSQGTGNQSTIGLVYRNGTLIVSSSKGLDNALQGFTSNKGELPLKISSLARKKSDTIVQVPQQQQMSEKRTVDDKHVPIVSSNHLPEWVSWAQITTLAEELGQHIDMIRVHLLVGLPADHTAWQQDRVAQKAATKVYVNEIMLDPAGDELPDEMLDEAARLWVAGYKMGISVRIPFQHQVPPKFWR